MRKEYTEEEKLKAIKKAIEDLNKDYKDGVVFADTIETLDVERLSTGCLSLDMIMGGGIPKGRITEIYGQESVGKSSLCIHLIKEAQRQGLYVLYIDVEHAVTMKYLLSLGIERSRLLYCKPRDAEEALDTLEKMLRSGGIGLAILDSVAALSPSKEVQGDTKDMTVGVVARFMAKAL